MKDLTALDADLKARHVTTEELSLALSSRLGYDYYDQHSPCTWWDRSCDVALLVGSFIHGFGNYEAMRNDEDLPFKDRIRQQAIANEACALAHGCFVAAANAAKKVFDDALGSAKSKAQEEVHAVVAAVYAASKVEDGQSKAKPGTESKPSSITPQVPLSNETDADDTHLITLTRLSESMAAAARAKSIMYTGSEESMELVKSSDSVVTAPSVRKESDSESQVAVADERQLPLHKRLPMPDARVLDSRLVRLVGHMEGDAALVDTEAMNGCQGLEWCMGKDVSVHEQARSRALERFLGMSKEQVDEERRDYSGIGFSGAQCASTHRSLDDGSDYCLGAATAGLAQVATGADAPRYLRALGVPMNITRFAISALVYADSATLETMLSDEAKRNLTEDEKTVMEKSERATDVGPSKDGECIVAEKEANPPIAADEELSKEVAEKSLFASPVIAPAFREDASVRAGLCASALHFGFPIVGGNELRVDAAIWGEISKQLSSPGFSFPELLFSLENLRSEATMVIDGLTIPSVDAVQQYFEFVLLPHCLRLCVMGNGPSTRNARESKGKFETAYGISNYPECSKRRQSPLPDPCASLADHSIEAVACASAILRRARLMRAAQFVVSGGLPLAKLMGILQSDAVRDSMDDLPAWWCPEIHDLGLLVQAATRGLFSVLVDRNSVFAPEMIKQHVRTRFISELASKDILRNASPDEVSAWIDYQARQFPSANTMERRLGLLCSAATAQVGDDVHRYDALPVWDHGAWPRK